MTAAVISSLITGVQNKRLPGKPTDLTMNQSAVCRDSGSTPPQKPTVTPAKNKRCVVVNIQGRQRKSWKDNIRKWTGLEFAMSQRVVENREKWRKLIAKSSVVPKRPSRLRDR